MSASFSFHKRLFAGKPGLAPAGDLLFFVSPKKVSSCRATPGLVDAPPQIKLAKDLPSASLTDEP